MKQSNAERNARQRVRRAENIAKWDKLGIDKKIISQYDLRNKNPEKIQSDIFKEIKKQSGREKARHTRERNKAIRYEQLKKHGFSSDEIKPKWTTSDNLMYEAMGRTNPKKVYHANEHLALCFAPRDGATGIMNTSEYKHLSFDEIKQRIKERVQEANDDPDGSGRLAIFVQMEHGDKEHCENMLDEWGQRGYNLKAGKLTDQRYYRLVNRNDWNMREYAEMMLCVIEQVENKAVPQTIEQFRYFAEDSGLPFEEIFN